MLVGKFETGSTDVFVILLLKMCSSFEISSRFSTEILRDHLYSKIMFSKSNTRDKNPMRPTRYFVGSYYYLRIEHHYSESNYLMEQPKTYILICDMLNTNCKYAFFLNQNLTGDRQSIKPDFYGASLIYTTYFNVSLG